MSRPRSGLGERSASFAALLLVAEAEGSAAGGGTQQHPGAGKQRLGARRAALKGARCAPAGSAARSQGATAGLRAAEAQLIAALLRAPLYGAR